MNSYDIFRKLTSGINFDRRRFNKDLQKIGVQKQSDAVQNSPDIEQITPDEKQDIGNDLVVKEEEEDVKQEMEEETDEEDSDDDDDGTEQSKVHFLSNSNIGRAKKEKVINRKEELDVLLEEVNKKRMENGIAIWGNDVPEPIMTFDEMVEQHKVKKFLLSNLLNQGYTAPTPIQMQSWPLMLQGREILGCAPTGSGKTAAFLLPVLNQLGGPRKQGFRAVILAPTRELAKQIFRECERLNNGLGLRIHLIANVNWAKKKFGPESAKKFDVLVTTPKRLVYLLREDDTPPLDLSCVEWLVVDESDRLFEGGAEGFRGQLATIYQACTGPKIKRALFSATFATEVEKWCKLNLNNVAMVTVGIRNTACKDVKQELLFCGNESGKVLAIRDILRKGYEPPVLVFVQTQDRAKDLFKELIYDNIMVDAIHAGRTEMQRDNVVKAFRERKIWVLICTELMARGIDFRGVNLVINYDCPGSTINYIHRVGRTGRANHQGKAITFWTAEDRPFLRSIAQVINDSGQTVPEWMLKLKKNKWNDRKLPNLPDRDNVSKAVTLEYRLSRGNSRVDEQRIKKVKIMEIEGGDDGDAATTPDSKPKKSMKNGKKKSNLKKTKFGEMNSEDQKPVRKIKERKLRIKAKAENKPVNVMKERKFRKKNKEDQKPEKKIKKKNFGNKNGEQKEPRKNLYKKKGSAKNNSNQKFNKKGKKKTFEKKAHSG